MDGKFVAYYRVSTQKQGQSGLGLDAQRKAVANYLNGGDWSLVGEFEEIESGKRDDRPKLIEALKLCELTGSTLVIAKLDRLTRDLHFLTQLQKDQVEFVACDNPHANKITIQIMVALAEQEREAISQRTKDALGSIKDRLERGESYVSKAGNTISRLGNPNGLKDPTPIHGTRARIARADAFAARVAPTILAMKAEGLSLAAIAARLAESHILAAKPGGKWSAMAVKRVLDRIA